MFPQFRMAQSNDAFPAERFVHDITPHHFSQAHQNVLQIIKQFLGFSHFLKNGLIQDKKCFQTVQFAAEENPLMVFWYQCVAIQMGHMLGFLIIISAGFIIHKFRLCLLFHLYLRHRQNFCGLHLWFFFPLFCLLTFLCGFDPFPVLNADFTLL